jgi:Helicase associated domain
MAPRRTRSWDDWFAVYKRKKKGSSMGSTMRDWTYKQRKMNADGTLSSEHKEKLDSVGFVWTAAVQCYSYDCDAWNNTFTLLETHHRENGNSRGPYQGKQLCKWVYDQRRALKDKESLTEIQQERWARLNTLGFWGATEQHRESLRSDESDLDPAAHASNTTAASCDQRLAEYKHKKENNLPMGAALRGWTFRQREANANGTLSGECKEKLDSVGFVWNATDANHFSVDHDAWNNNFTLLETHHREQGNFRVPIQDKPLYRWAYRQRSTLKDKESLDEVQQERWARLNALGFWGAADVQFETTGSDESGLVPTAHASDTTATSWDQRLAEYKHKKENNLPMGAALGSWTYRQREANANGTLSRECKEKLDSVGFVWNATDSSRFSVDHDAWNNNFTLLETHHREQGNFRVPIQDKPLYYWAYRQRSKLKDKESLDEVQQERWARLNALGFWDATDVQVETAGSDENGLFPTAHAAAACARPASDGECEMGWGQQRSGIVRVTVSVIARDLLNGAIHATRDQLKLYNECRLHFLACEGWRQRKAGVSFNGSRARLIHLCFSQILLV